MAGVSIVMEKGQFYLAQIHGVDLDFVINVTKSSKESIPMFVNTAKVQVGSSCLSILCHRNLTIKIESNTNDL